MGCNCAILPDELNKGKIIAQMPKTTALEETEGRFFVAFFSLFQYIQ